MSQRHAIEQHRRTLSEVRDILGAMKNLALMETRKLERYHANQHALVNGLRQAALDFLNHSELPRPSPPPASTADIYLLFGSERGFCGAFNEALRLAFEGRQPNGRCIAVGRRLSARFEGDPRLVAAIDGPSVAEETSAVLERVVATVDELQRHKPLSLTALYQGADGIAACRLLPVFSDLSMAASAQAHGPVVHLPPNQLLPELGEHYLFAVLYRLAYASLLAENQQRMQHLDSAVHRLDNRLDELARRSRTLRQEEITEEIEVLLLNAGVATSAPPLELAETSPFQK